MLEKVRRFLRIGGTIIILSSLFGLINLYIGLPLAISLSLILDLTYVIEYYRKGEAMMARKYLCYMIVFLAIILVLMSGI